MKIYSTARTAEERAKELAEDKKLLDSVRAKAHAATGGRPVKWCRIEERSDGTWVQAEADEAAEEEMRKRKRDAEIAARREAEEAEEREAAERRANADVAKRIAAGELGTPIARYDDGRNHETMENTTIKQFKKFITMGPEKMGEEERSALALSGAGAVIPAQIWTDIITSEKYSDLLRRATIINRPNAGNIKVPIMASSAATWKAENSSVSADADTLTYLELGGAELMRAFQYSAAVENMSDSQFENWVAQNISAEVVDTLEKAFINGAGPSAVAPAVATPHKGLSALTYTSSNSVECLGSISAVGLATGLAKLPVKYSRNAILLMNAKTALSVVGLLTGTAEYAYSLADGATKFMGHDIVISEHVSDDEVYIIDPRELYVRFALPMSIDVDRHAAFLSASTIVRCLTVVDFCWNTAAVIQVTAGSATTT